MPKKFWPLLTGRRPQQLCLGCGSVNSNSNLARIRYCLAAAMLLVLMLRSTEAFSLSWTKKMPDKIFTLPSSHTCRTWYLRRLILRSSSSSSTHAPVSEHDRRAARAKRKRKIGFAKAVDHHNMYPHVYNPGPPFQARTGLPNCLMMDDGEDDDDDSTRKLFTVLGIETSCDDTGAAVVQSDGKILGEALASQAEVHEPWGGVVPSLAREAHTKAVDRVIRQALEGAQMDMDQVDAVAVTVGPGLEICLRVGVQAAVDLATKYNKPFVGVHHLEAHILMARLPLLISSHHKKDQPQSTALVETDSQGSQSYPRAVHFPFLALLVSGGHCQMLRCHGIGRYEILGGTLDDSLGEAYDKTARLLGLPVGGGGGPAVERLAGQAPENAEPIPLTIPMRNRHDCDFSFAGLKTNVRRAAEQLVREHNEQSTIHGDKDNIIETPDQLPEPIKANLAASFQNVAIQHVEDRLKRAMTIVSSDGNDGICSRIDTLAVVGGVAANQELRSRLEKLCQKRGWTMVVPPPRLCTDQGAMSAWAGVERLLVGSSDERSIHNVFARYPFASFTTADNDSAIDQR